MNNLAPQQTPPPAAATPLRIQAAVWICIGLAAWKLADLIVVAARAYHYFIDGAPR